MTLSSAASPNGNDDHEKECSDQKGLMHGLAETPFNEANEDQRGFNNSRRASLSKREIMEELSRARFPWDE